MIVVALTAAVNAVAALALHEGHGGHDHWGSIPSSERDLNMRSAVLHGRRFPAPVGVAIAGLVIVRTGGFYWLDPAVSLGIGVLIAVQAWRLLREAGDVLLESTPDDLDVATLASTMTGVDGVEEVHDLHAWSLE